MTAELERRSFATAGELWRWLDQHHQTHPGLWVVLAKSGVDRPSITFADLLEAGIAYGWSESTRRAGDYDTYLQKFTPRRTRGTTSARNEAIADRLEAQGRMSPAGRAALGRRPGGKTGGTRRVE
ncbi:YdeI/OmpD-associated family protein [Gordonia sp. (in: high G+C Gram-positive bacteria)]|uniref:YdeI/OmpD-associated family protein n=1 Tax=Gordonia sp. (in: high G+C Gram-positive bacteria) TaxID=84139 RepID=UPI0039E38E0E